MPLLQTIRLPPPTDDDEFEDIVVRALQVRHGSVHVTRFGRSGQGQQGIDGWASADPRGFVFQATLQRGRLMEKLERDLAAFDGAGLRSRQLFIFATAVPRDAALQVSVDQICGDRLSRGRCPVEILFWEDLRQFFSADLMRRHYPEYPIESAPVAPVADGLLALGWDAVVEASLVEQTADSWRLRLGAPITGGADAASGFVDRFEVEGRSAWACFSGLGSGRLLIASPSRRGDELLLQLAPRPPRSSVYDEGMDIALGDDGDIFPDLRTVSGFPAALQSMSLAMSTQLGEWFGDPRIGTRCAEFHRTVVDPQMLGVLFELELTRLAFVATGDSIRLPFIERVLAGC